MYARRLSQAAKRNALQRRCEIDPLSGTSCTSVDDYHMSLPQVELDNINHLLWDGAAPSLLRAICSIPSFGIAKFAAIVLISRCQQKCQQIGRMELTFYQCFQ
jgi:hypothetical protein